MLNKYPKGNNNIIRNNRVHNNAFAGKHGPGISVYGGSHIVNNICWKNDEAIENLGSIQPSATNLVVDPKFMNEATFNFRLQSNSPAINSGSALSEVNTDINGTSHPSGTAYDIGAWEYSTAVVPIPSLPVKPKSPKNLQVR